MRYFQTYRISANSFRPWIVKKNSFCRNYSRKYGTEQAGRNKRAERKDFSDLLSKQAENLRACSSIRDFRVCTKTGFVFFFINCFKFGSVDADVETQCKRLRDKVNNCCDAIWKNIIIGMYLYIYFLMNQNQKDLFLIE